MRLYVKYENNNPISIFTQNLPIPKGENPVVFDLIEAFQNRTGSLLANIDSGSITLCQTIDGVDYVLESDASLSTLFCGRTAKTSLVIKKGSQIQFNNEAYKLLSIKRKLCSDDDSICPDKKKAIATPIKFKPQKIVPNVVTPMDDGEFVFVPTSVSEIEDPISNDKLLQNSNSGINMNLVDAFKDGNNVSHIENFQVALKTPKRDSLMPYSSYATQSKQYSPSSIEHGSQVKPDVCQKKSIEIIALDSDSEGLDTSVKGRFRFNVPSKNLETSSEGQGRSLFLTAASSSFQSTSTPISYSFNRRTLSPRGFSTTIKPNEKPFDRARYRDAIGFDATSEEEVQESPVQSGPESQSESLFVDDSGIRQCASKSENCNFLNDNEADQKKETDNNCDKILPARTHISIADYLASLEQPDYRMMDTPNGLLVELKSFQRQSLAFMYDVEKIKSDCWSHPTGGLLTDEVGMGKTAVCIALILSNPGVPLIKKPLIYGLKNAERVRTKATLIIAPPSILGQWEIELKKFAPRTLRILWHYGSKRNNNIDLDFTFYDVVLTTVGCLPSDRSKDVVWHRYLINNRIILDEIHCKKSGIAKKLLCTYKWGITATPLSKSKEELAELLKQISNAPDQKESVSCDCALGNTALGQAIDRLHLPLVKKVVMRHSKEGEKAFGENNPEDSMILPSSNVRNLISRLSHDEKIVYDFVVSRKSKAIKSFAQSSTGNTFAIDNMIEPFLQAVNSPGYVTFISHFEMPATLRDYKNLPEYKALKRQYDIAKLASERCKSIIPSKIKSLKADLEEKLKLNPAARVLILTRSLRLLPLLIDSIQQVGFHVESFTGSHTADRRSVAVKRFQSKENPKAMALVLTMRTANVGLTLTAASCIYLLEPSMDPAEQDQAFGRIHRLGQTKDVELVQLMTVGTIEEDMNALCKDRRAGGSNLGNAKENFSNAEINMLMRSVLEAQDSHLGH